MTSDVSALTLESAVLRRTLVDGNAMRYPESHYLDFVIDGRSLSARIPGGRGLATPLNRAWLSTVGVAVEVLLGTHPEGILDPGRVMLYVCGECGDLGCGSVTASLTVKGDTVTWSDFAWDNGYEPTDPITEAPGAITFAKAGYTDALRGAEERVAAFPFDQLAHEGRKFLWPWQWGWRLPKADA